MKQLTGWTFAGADTARRAHQAERPVAAVTNGVHVPTWIASDLAELFAKYLGPDWIDRQDDAALLERYGLEIPVLLVDGRKVAKYRVSEKEVRRILIGS